MSVSCDDFAGAATLLALGSEEIDWRNGASRAYYGAFHAARALASCLPDNSNLPMGEHQRLSHRFRMEGSRLGRRISDLLQAMKRVRHIADYDLSSGFAQQDATHQLRDFATLRERIRTLELRLVADGAAEAARKPF